MKTVTKRKLLIEGLTSGQQYVFKMAAAGSDPNRTWRDHITLLWGILNSDLSPAIRKPKFIYLVLRRNKDNALQ